MRNMRIPCDLFPNYQAMVYEEIDEDIVRFVFNLILAAGRRSADDVNDLSVPNLPSQARQAGSRRFFVQCPSRIAFFVCCLPSQYCL
jgi:hypothetical protein